ncbi:MAG: phage tail sheath subtilisin-like domain-containing protein [Pseudomonadota bacterium]
MTTRLTPGTYTIEAGAGPRAIQGVSNSIAGFIGEAERGIPDRPTLITGFGAYQRAFGGHRRGPAGFLAQAVESFFEAGGSQCFVVRVLPVNAGTGVSPAVLARGRDPWGIERPVLRFRARGAGRWSGALRLHIERATSFEPDTFAVRVELVEGGRARNAEPRFDNLRLDPNHENYAVRVINEISRFIEVEDLLEAEADLAVRTLPLLPEAAPRLSLQTTGADTFSVVEGGQLQFRWTDATAPNRDHLATVSFPDTVDEMSLGDMARILTPALAPDYRVRGPEVPAELASPADGPFDVTGANALTLTIDAAPVNIPLPVQTAASLNLGAEPFAGIAAGGDIELSVDGGPVTTYTLVAGDAAADPITLAELVTVIDREFPGLTAADDGGDLRVTSDTLGPESQVAVAGILATHAGDPGPDQGDDGVTAADAASAEDVARLINTALGGAPYLAIAEGDSLRLLQSDLAPHTLTVSATTAPDPVFELDAVADGPVPTGNDDISIEPAVATRAYASIELLDGETQFLGGGTDRVIHLRTSLGDDLTVNLAQDAAMSPAELAQALEEAAGADAVQGLDLVASERHVTVAVGPVAAGVTVAFEVNGPAMWQAADPIAGASGAIVEDQGALTLTVSEPFLPGVPRFSTPIFPTPRAVGRDDGSPMDPNLRPAITDDDPVRLLGGTDGTGPVGLAQYVGTTTPTGRRTGLRSYEGGPIAMLGLPGQTDGAFISSAMAWADANDVFLIVDGPGSVDRNFEISADAVRQFAESLPARSNSAALYWPWIRRRDALGLGRNPTRFVPPCGHVAGVFARTDALRNVAKAPAGVEAQVSGAIGLQHQLIDAEQDLLNPVGVNCIRRMPGAGTVIWGSRTLAPDPQWRYVPVRRTALFLKRTLKRNLLWAVFEPNDEILWEQLRDSVNSFMLGLYQQRLFAGSTPEEAFRVQCDRETNPPELQIQGIVSLSVFFAPLNPAEFVLINIAQQQAVVEAGGEA